MVHPHIGATEVAPLVAQGRFLAVWPHHPLCWLSCLCLLSGAKISNKALTQKGSRIFNMVTNYCNISLDHFANHLIYLSTASSFWFSLNSSYEHDFHLLLELTSLEPLALVEEVCMQEEWHPTRRSGPSSYSCAISLSSISISKMTTSLALGVALPLHILLPLRRHCPADCHCPCAVHHRL